MASYWWLLLLMLLLFVVLPLAGAYAKAHNVDVPGVGNLDPARREELTADFVWLGILLGVLLLFTELLRNVS